MVLRNKISKGEPVLSARDEKGRIKEAQRQNECSQKFKDFAWKWFEMYVKTNNKHSEIKNKEYALRGSIIPFFGETQIDQITTLQVEQYKASEMKKGLSSKTTNNHLIILGKCLRTAQEWFDLPKIPKITKLKVPPQKFEFLSREESENLIANAVGVWREVIMTALKTGLRRGELVALQWQDINWHNHTLSIRRSWCDTKKGFDTPKSNRERHIPLTDELYATLFQRKKTTGFVFIENGKRIESKQINRKLSEICDNAGLREITCHVLRHT